MKLQKYLNNYEASPKWDTRRTERTEEILRIILTEADGDILEVGAHSGTTTKVFCEIAKQFNRHVYVIDPWDNRQQGNKSAYDAFVRNTSGLDNLTVIRAGSETDNAKNTIGQIAKLEIAFYLLDGLHTKDAVANDIVSYCKFISVGGVLCVDDWTGPYGFSAAIQQSTSANLPKNFTALKCPDTFIERYFIRNL